MMTYRSVAHLIDANPTSDGDGLALHRAFPNPSLRELDPFLLLDHLGPTLLAPGEARGFPPHPHRGFEAVTYLLSGEMQHRDSWGNHGILGPGDVQWMTAGSGLVHSEQPGESLMREGGTLHGFQLWVNLPKRRKMQAPRYQDTRAASIPVVRNGDGTVTVKVIAGEAMGASGVIDTEIPIRYLHITLAPGSRCELPLPRRDHAFAFVVSGEVDLNGTVARKNQTAIFDRGGENVTISNPGVADAELLLLAGEPVGEPVVRYGPFVMNSKAEIVQAMDDFRAGRMGTLQ